MTIVHDEVSAVTKNLFHGTQLSKSHDCLIRGFCDSIKPRQTHQIQTNLNKLFYAFSGHVLQRIEEPGRPPSFRLQLQKKWAVAHRARLLGYVTQSAQANSEAEAVHAAAERMVNEEEADVVH